MQKARHRWPRRYILFVVLAKTVMVKIDGDMAMAVPPADDSREFL